MANDAGERWRGESWFIEEWHQGVGWAAGEGEPHRGTDWTAGGDASQQQGTGLADDHDPQHPATSWATADGPQPQGTDWATAYDRQHQAPGWATADGSQQQGTGLAADRELQHQAPSWATADGSQQQGTDWATSDRQPGDRRRPGGPKARRGRLLVGFALGAATVVGLQLGSSMVTSPPVAVVAGTALPAAGAAAPAARPAAPTSTPPPPPATSTPAAPAAQPSTAPPAPQQPGTVRLPAGGTATLVRKDLGPGGELPVPDNLGQATWWGAELDAAGGASVFAGHVNWRGATGPFAELWNARIGAEVTIVDKAGKTWSYRISQLLTVHKNDLPAQADDLFGQSGPHRVVLATCGGRWVGGSDGYEENRIVIAEPA